MSIKRYDPIAYSYMGGWSWDTAAIKPCEDGEYVSYDDHVAELARLMERCMDEDAVQGILVDLKALAVEMENPLYDRQHGLQRSIALINEALLLLSNNPRESLDRSSLQPTHR